MFARIDLFDIQTWAVIGGCGIFCLIVAGIFSLAILPEVNTPVEPRKPWAP